MTFNDRVKFVATVTICFSVTAAAIPQLDSFAYQLFTAVVAVEFLAIVVATTDPVGRSRWIARVRWLAIFGTVLMTGIAVWFLTIIIPN